MHYSQDKMHLYIHIPFCRQKCPYCKFALTPVFDEFKKKRYIEYIKKEIRDFFQDSNPSIIDEKNTIYFGGGTPSVLSHEEIREILVCFPDYQTTSEISFEANPEDITREYVVGLFDLGINRLSLGIQTLSNISLKEIHRSDRENIINALESIRKNIHDSISVNVDFILGLPHVKPGETLENIRELHARFPCITHTSVYMLEDELYPRHWKSLSISEKEMQEDFLQIIEYFQGLGWNHYELSNFAKPGYESLHNQSYWNHSSYRGFGLSASSFEEGKRWTNSTSFSGYYRGQRVDEENLTQEQIEIEKMMFGLRKGGIIIKKSEKIQELIGEGLLEIQDSQIKPTKTGIFLLDYIMGKLI